MLERLRDEYEERIQQLTRHEGDADHKKLSVYSAEYEELSKEILAEERKTIRPPAQRTRHQRQRSAPHPARP